MLLEGNNNISLRNLYIQDKVKLAELANTKYIWDNVRDFFPHPYTEKDAKEFIELCNSEKPKVTFAIDLGKELVGVTGLELQKDVYRKSAEIGYWVGEAYRNKGVATEAVKLMVNYGFEKLNLNRIYSGVFEYNRASQKVLLKCGFTYEGKFTNAVIKNNKVINELRYAILRENT